MPTTMMVSACQRVIASPPPLGAGPTHPLAGLRRSIGVLGRVLVTAGAMRFACIKAGGGTAVEGEDVLSLGGRPHVPRVHACRTIASMVDGESGRDWPYIPLVNGTMRDMGHPGDSEDDVAVRLSLSGPVDALIPEGRWSEPIKDDRKRIRPVFGIDTELIVAATRQPPGERLPLPSPLEGQPPRRAAQATNEHRGLGAAPLRCDRPHPFMAPARRDDGPEPPELLIDIHDARLQ